MSTCPTYARRLGTRAETESSTWLGAAAYVNCQTAPARIGSAIADIERLFRGCPLYLYCNVSLAALPPLPSLPGTVAVIYTVDHIFASLLPSFTSSPFLLTRDAGSGRKGAGTRQFDREWRCTSPPYFQHRLREEFQGAHRLYEPTSRAGVCRDSL